MIDIFSLPDFRFPKGFLWGSATAGHQIEGNNHHSQRWYAEQQGKIVDPDGKEFPIPEPSGLACDSYRRFREDTELLAELGHQAYRFSLEWARIEPEKGHFVEEEVRHYLDVLESLKAKGIKTIVTLCHFSVPQWFHACGTFAKRENLSYFERYVEYVVPRIAPLVDYWIVLNEVFGRGDEFSFNCLRAHGLAYRFIKTCSISPVSSAHAAVQPFPYRYYDELDNLMAGLDDFCTNGVLLHAVRHGELIAPGREMQECPEIKNAMDFWAINIYTRRMIDSRRQSGRGERFAAKKLRLIDMDFYLDEMYPEGTTSMLERFHDRPVMITENGCACNDDRFRIVYLALYLSAIYEAIRRGIDVRGYLYWSLMDNYEWTSFKPRFGLVAVDFQTFARTPRPSARFFKDIIAHNGFSQAILFQYLQETPSLIKKTKLSK